ERSHSVFGIPQDMFDWIKKLSEVGRDDPHPFLDGFTSLSPRQMERNESPQARALHRPTGLLLLDETERRPGLSVDHSKYASVQARINRLTGESPCRRRGRRTNGAMTSNSSGWVSVPFWPPDGPVARDRTTNRRHRLGQWRTSRGPVPPSACSERRPAQVPAWSALCSRPRGPCPSSW